MNIITLSPAIFYAVLLAIQYFLSRTGNKIVSNCTCSICNRVYLFIFIRKARAKYMGAIIFGIIGLLFLLGQWDSAQKDNKKKTKKNQIR